MDIARHLVGSHEVFSEGDILWVRFRGVYAPEEARQIMSLVDQLFRAHGAVYMIGDLSASALPGAETRRVLATWPYQLGYVAVMIGTNLAQRAFLQLIISAERMLNKSPKLLLQLCATEADALAFVTQHRQQHSAKR